MGFVVEGVIAFLLTVSPAQAMQQSPAPLHVLKIAAGPAGSEVKGTFTLTEERTTFSRAEHRDVLVFFQWEGVPGRHKLEAKWSSPQGGTSTSVIDYVAKERRFGAYWQMPVTPSMALGAWSIEATVDGQPGGRLSFDIIDTTAPPAEPAKPVKRALTQAELHERLSKSFVLLIRATGTGRELDPSGGVVGADGQVFTEVSMLDSVQRLQAIVPGAPPQQIGEALQLQRRPGWAILPARTESSMIISSASAEPKVGDRCYSMSGTPAGARVLLEGQVTGTTIGAAKGWTVSFFNGSGMSGSPVVNELGELLGILGLTETPELRLGRAPGTTYEFGNMPLIPLASITARAGAVPATFEALRARGLLMEPLVGDNHVLSGGFASNIPRIPMSRPEDQRQEFSTKEKEFFIFVTWSPRQRLKGLTMVQMYDADNRIVLSSKPSKVDLKATTLALSSIKVPTPQTPGTYRVEVFLDGKPAWRDYVRIVP